MKKGQIQLGELVIIVIIVMVLLIMGLFLYGSVTSRERSQTAVQLRSLDAVDLAHDASALPEIGCGFAQEETECIDIVRMKIFAEEFESAGPNSDFRNYYQYKFGAANITIEEMYPSSSESWTIYANEPEEFSSQVAIRLPVTLYHPINKTNSFGVMTVVMYS